MVLPVVVPGSLSNLGSGFDCVGLAVTLYNQFLFTPEGGRGQFMVDYLPVEPESHLVSRTIRAAEEHFGALMPHGLGLTQAETVPRSRGLGSSSTAVVAGYIAWSHYTRTRPSVDEAMAFLTQMEGHPDNVSAAFLGGAVLSVAHEGGVHSVPIPLAAGVRVVVVVPEKQILTADAREVLPESVPLADAVYNASRVGMLLTGLRDGDAKALRLGTQDRWHQAARASLLGPVDEVIEAALGHGAAAAFLSGSGSTLAALVVDPEADADAIGRAMGRVCTGAGLRHRMHVLDPSPYGAWQLFVDHGSAGA